MSQNILLLIFFCKNYSHQTSHYKTNSRLDLALGAQFAHLWWLFIWDQTAWLFWLLQGPRCVATDQWFSLSVPQPLSVEGEGESDGPRSLVVMIWCDVGTGVLTKGHLILVLALICCVILNR